MPRRVGTKSAVLLRAVVSCEATIRSDRAQNVRLEASCSIDIETSAFRTSSS